MRNKIDRAIDQHLFKLNSEYEKLVNGLDNPEIILTELFDPNDRQPFYNYITQALRKEGIDYHSLQNYLTDYVRKYFLEFDNEVEIGMPYASQYPNHLTVKYRGHLIMTFSFYYHTFKDEAPRDKIDYLKNEIKRSKERIERLRDEQREYVSYSENRLRLLKYKSHKFKGAKVIFRSIRDTAMLFWNWNRIGERIDKIIKRREHFINEELKDIERYIDEIKKLNDVLPKLESKYRKWEEKMIDLGYRETK